MPAIVPADQSSGIIAHAIQLAIVPVFLLTAFAGLLGIMATRLGRVIDRARSLESGWLSMDATAQSTARRELHQLEQCRHVCSWSITCCTAAALLVCLVIVTLFAEEFFAMDLKWLASGLFVGAMMFIIVGLVLFLREVYLATHTMSIDLTRFR